MNFETFKDEFGTYAVLWKNSRFIVMSPENPHIPKKEGSHLIVLPVKQIVEGWDNPELGAETFKLALKVAKIIIEEHVVDWANLQYNDNWRQLKGMAPRFHIHIYGRKRTGKTWGQPVVLPNLGDEFRNEPLEAETMELLSERFRKELAAR